MSDAGEAGLTLVEMLVVLAIIGIASGATLLALAPPRGPGVEVEAHRLAGVMQQAADATMTTDVPAALVADASGYKVGRGERHALPDGMSIVGAPAEPQALALSDAAAVDLTIARGDEAWAVSFDGLRATASKASR